MSIVNHATLIRQVYFPKEVLIFSSITGKLFDFAISTLILAGMIIFYQMDISLTILYVPVLVMIQMMLMIGVSLFLSSINTYYRDINAAITLIMQFWMYTSPIIYPLSKVPQKFLLLYQINPMVGIIDGYRRTIIENLSPQWGLLLYSTVFSLLLLVAAFAFFKRLEPTFADTV
jgi:ABC-type polysaccharide/polyol phosphate export permease